MYSVSLITDPCGLGQRHRQWRQRHHQHRNSPMAARSRRCRRVYQVGFGSGSTRLPAGTSGRSGGSQVSRSRLRGWPLAGHCYSGTVDLWPGHAFRSNASLDAFQQPRAARGEWQQDGRVHMTPAHDRGESRRASRISTAPRAAAISAKTAYRPSSHFSVFLDQRHRASPAYGRCELVAMPHFSATPTGSQQITCAVTCCTLKPSATASCRVRTGSRRKSSRATSHFAPCLALNLAASIFRNV